MRRHWPWVFLAIVALAALVLVQGALSSLAAPASAPKPALPEPAPKGTIPERPAPNIRALLFPAGSDAQPPASAHVVPASGSPGTTRPDPLGRPASALPTPPAARRFSVRAFPVAVMPEDPRAKRLPWRLGVRIEVAGYDVRRIEVPIVWDTTRVPGVTPEQSEQADGLGLQVLFQRAPKGGSLTIIVPEGASLETAVPVAELAFDAPTDQTTAPLAVRVPSVTLWTAGRQTLRAPGHQIMLYRRDVGPRSSAVQPGGVAPARPDSDGGR